MGFRACVAAVGWIPATVLNIVLPASLLHRLYGHENDAGSKRDQVSLAPAAPFCDGASTLVSLVLLIRKRDTL